MKKIPPHLSYYDALKTGKQIQTGNRVCVHTHSSTMESRSVNFESDNT